MKKGFLFRFVVSTSACLGIMASVLGGCGKQGQGDTCSRDRAETDQVNADCEDGLVCTTAGFCCPANVADQLVSSAAECRATGTTTTDASPAPIDATRSDATSDATGNATGDSASDAAVEASPEAATPDASDSGDAAEGG